MAGAWIDVGLYDQIKKVSEQTGVSISHKIRQAMVNWVESTLNPQKTSGNLTTEKTKTETSKATHGPK